MKFTTTYELTYRGESKPIQEWAKQYQLPYTTLHSRLTRGWDVERALTQLPRESVRGVEVNDTVRGLKDWLAIIGISHQALYESARNHKITPAEEIRRRLKENPPNKGN